ncbi:MAG: hypothetical protein ACK526_21650, partial [Planctomyces sp.]
PVGLRNDPATGIRIAFSECEGDATAGGINPGDSEAFPERNPCYRHELEEYSRNHVEIKAREAPVLIQPVYKVVITLRVIICSSILVRSHDGSV